MKKTIETETNMERIKTTSKWLLDMDITKTEFWPMIAQHPFTNSGSFFWRDENGDFQSGILERGTEAYEKWTAQYTNLIDRAQTAYEISFIMNKPWRLFFISLVEPFLATKDFAVLLKEAFMEMEHPNMDPNVSTTQLKNYFKKCDKNALMEEEELEVYDSLPDVITVYRGVTSYNNKKIKVLSWTIDPEVAKWFANRYQQQGQVYTATISKKHILAYFGGRNEAEVIVDPSKLKDIKLLLDLSEENRSMAS